MKITQAIVDKLNALLDKGLCHGASHFTQITFCVQQAVDIAIHEGHKVCASDNPAECVNEHVRSLGLRLNDQKQCWTSSKARAEGLRRFAIAELGSQGVVDGQEFFGNLNKRYNAKYPDRESFQYYWLKTEADACEVAEMAVQTLIELKSPGAAYLDKPQSELKQIQKQLQRNWQFGGGQCQNLPA